MMNKGMHNSFARVFFAGRIKTQAERKLQEYEEKEKRELEEKKNGDARGGAAITGLSSGVLSAETVMINFPGVDPGVLQLSTLLPFSACLASCEYSIRSNMSKNKANDAQDESVFWTDFEKDTLALDEQIEIWQNQLEDSKKPLAKLQQEREMIQLEIVALEVDFAKTPSILNEMKLTAKQHALQQHAKLIEQAEVLFQDAASKMNAHLQQLLIAKENRRLIERQKQVQSDHQQLTNAQPSEADHANAQLLIELSENALREMSAAQQKRTLSFY